MARGKHSADRGYFESLRNDNDEFYSNAREEARKYYREQNGYTEEEDDSYDSYDDEPNYLKVKIICAIVAIVIIIGVAIFVSRDTKSEEPVNNVVETNTVEVKEMAGTYEGYNVIGKIKINKIGIEQYILDSTEEKALENGVIKLYGSSINNYGNLTLAGHNKDDVFGKLNELDRGDTITLIEKDFTETEYEVTEIKTVDPDDLTVLIEQEDKIELTLVTCENATTKRLIIKAEEK